MAGKRHGHMPRKGVLKRLEERLLKERLGHMEFQSFVCWMLFICALLALIIPTGLVVADIRDFGCVGVDFTIVAHYGSVDWMQDMFSNFKKHMEKRRNNNDISFNVCYRLIISETAPLTRSYRPTVYQPQILYWLNNSQYEWINKRPNKREGKYFIEFNSTTGATSSCTSTTSIPMGLIVRDEFKKAFNYSNPIEFSHIVDIATMGWRNYTIRENMNNSNIEIMNETTLLLGMGHPNVTSSGYLTLYLALHSTDENVTDLVNQESIRNLTESTYEIAPNDLFHIYTLRDFSKEYLHAAIGFENDVVKYNIYQNESANLTFIYFKETFWVDYPVCVLEEAYWVSNRHRQLGNWFREFVTNETNTNKLLDYGMRPAGWDSRQYSFRKDGVNVTVPGINLAITKNESIDLGASILNVTDAADLRNGWRDVKRPAYVLILHDISKDAAKSVSSTKTRWIYAKRALPELVEVLEDNAIIDLKCFSSESQSQLKCGGKEDFNRTGTLADTRRPLLDFLDNSITTTSQRNSGFFTRLKENLNELKKLQLYGNSTHNYFILTVSGDDKTKKASDPPRLEKITDLLTAAQSTNRTDQIHVFPILFFGTEATTSKKFDNTTWSTMGSVASLTNGRRWSADDDIEDVYDIVRYYF